MTITAKDKTGKQTETSTGKCPKCGEPATIQRSGDLNSGWSGNKWGEGVYIEGAIVTSIHCEKCGFEDVDVEVND